MESIDTCLFGKIVARSVEAAIVWEDEVTLVFLDHRPLFPGHCLVIPKTHYETLTDLPEDQVAVLFGMARRVAMAVEQAMESDGSFVAINNRVSQSVPHLHIHVVPRRKKDGLRGFFWPRQKYESTAEMESVRARLHQAIQSVHRR